MIFLICSSVCEEQHGERQPVPPSGARPCRDSQGQYPGGQRRRPPHRAAPHHRCTQPVELLEERGTHHFNQLSLSLLNSIHVRVFVCGFAEDFVGVPATRSNETKV